MTSKRIAATPAELRDLATRIVVVADDVEAAVVDFQERNGCLHSALISSALHDFASTWQGDASDAFKERFESLPADLGMIAHSYDAVATALRRYAGLLDRFQQDATAALTRAELADQRRASAVAARDRASARVADLH